MLTVATDRIEGRCIVAYLGIVNGDAILGAKMIRDFFGGIRDAVGGRVGGYEKALRGAKDAAFEDPIEEAHALGANAVVGLDLDYETVGESRLMVSANGTAVRLV